MRSLIDADNKREENSLQIQLAVTPPPAVENPAQNVTTHLLPAHISYFDQPNKFYLHREDILQELTALQYDVLANEAPKLLPLNDFRVGVTCVLKWNFDEDESVWYRGRIIGNDGDQISIQCIDYGHTVMISDKSLLKTSNDSLSGIPPLAMRCSLPLGSTAGDWSETACKKMQEISEHLIHFEVISESCKVYYVNLWLGERNIVKELIESGEASAVDIVKSGERKVVTHIDSIEVSDAIDKSGKFKCKCGKKFKRRQHLQRHQLKEGFECAICSKKFTRKDNLVEHMNKTHNKQRTHLCNVCGKLFGRSTHLRKHEKIHFKK